MTTPDIHPDIAPLSFLVGTWVGRGEGHYPTIEPFTYTERVTFSPLPKPLLAYEQRTAHAETKEPLHAESGWLRFPASLIEMTVAQPTGVVECYAGQLDGTRLVLASTAVGATPSAGHHAIGAVRREIEVNGDELRYRLWMAAVGQPMQVHLEAALTRQHG